MVRKQLYKRPTKAPLEKWRKIHLKKPWATASKIFRNKKGKGWCCYFYFN